MMRADLAGLLNESLTEIYSVVAVDLSRRVTSRIWSHGRQLCRAASPEKEQLFSLTEARREAGRQFHRRRLPDGFSDRHRPRISA